MYSMNPYGGGISPNVGGYGFPQSPRSSSSSSSYNNYSPSAVSNYSNYSPSASSAYSNFSNYSPTAVSSNFSPNYSPTLNQYLHNENKPIYYSNSTNYYGQEGTPVYNPPMSYSPPGGSYYQGGTYSPSSSYYQGGNYHGGNWAYDNSNYHTSAQHNNYKSDFTFAPQVTQIGDPWAARFLGRPNVFGFKSVGDIASNNTRLGVGVNSVGDINSRNIFNINSGNNFINVSNLTQPQPTPFYCPPGYYTPFYLDPTQYADCPPELLQYLGQSFDSYRGAFGGSQNTSTNNYNRVLRDFTDA